MVTSSSVPPRHGATHTDPFRILVVCTANMCRSPIAEYLLRARLPTGSAWSVRSAGVQAMSGASMHPLAAAVLRERGLDIAGFRTTSVDGALVAQADLVLTAERAHRAQVVRLHPAAVRRTFTLRQLARLLDGVSPMPHMPADIAGRWLIEQAHANASTLNLRQPRADDVEDPMGRRIRAFRHCADLIDRAIATITEPIRE